MLIDMEKLGKYLDTLKKEIKIITNKYNKKADIFKIY